MTVAAFMSKIAQAHWILWLFWLIVFSPGLKDYALGVREFKPNQVNYPWFVLWQGMITTLGSIFFVFLFSNYKKLRGIFMNVLGSYLSVFDLVTDVNLLVDWVRQAQNGNQDYLYIWTAIQAGFIIVGQLFSCYFIRGYYFQEKLAQNNANSDDKGVATKVY